MKINCEKIKATFPDKAWAYAESLDAVRIGKWDGEKIVFFDGDLKEELLQVLRLFTEMRELKFTGSKCRDTTDYNTSDFIPELAESKYFMYGEQAEVCGNYTKLSEERGGSYYFPTALDFPKGSDGKSIVGLKLGIKNFVKYNPVPVCRKDGPYNSGLGANGAGALEVVDYAYTGFYYEDDAEVKL
jgi:hypothetical protein